MFWRKFNCKISTIWLIMISSLKFIQPTEAYSKKYQQFLNRNFKLLPLQPTTTTCHFFLSLTPKDNGISTIFTSLITPPLSLLCFLRKQIKRHHRTISGANLLICLVAWLAWSFGQPNNGTWRPAVASFCYRTARQGKAPKVESASFHGTRLALT